MDPIAAKSLQYNVALRTRWMAHDACLTRSRGGAVWALSISAGLEPPERRVGSALMLEVIGLSWPGVQFRFRFPLPQDDQTLRQRTERQRRDYCVPYRLAMRALVPDALLEGFEREGLDARAAAEEAGVPLSDLAWRVSDWRSRLTTPAPAKVTSISEYLASGTLKPASQLVPTAKKGQPRRTTERPWRSRHREVELAMRLAETREPYDP